MKASRDGAQGSALNPPPLLDSRSSIANPASPAPDPDRNLVPLADLTLKRQLQWLFFWRIAVLTLLLGVSLALHTKEHILALPDISHIGYFIAGVYLFTIGSSALLSKITCYSRFAYLQLLVDVALTSVLVFFTGGSKSIFIVIFFFPIIAAGYILYRRGGLFLAAAATLLYGTALLIEYFQGMPGVLSGFGPKQSVNPVLVMHHFSIPSLTFFLVAILSSLLSERLRMIEKELSRTTLNYDRLFFLYKQIFDDITSGIITVDHQGRVTSFNRSSEKITGFTAKEVLGQNINHKFRFLQPDLDFNPRPVVDLVRKDGAIIPVGYSWSRLNMPDRREDCRIFSFQDLSQIKKMEEQVKQAEKMAAIGEMAAGIAHEFRNPLAAVSGAAQVLAQDMEEDPARQGLMNIIIRECDRLELTIGEFLQFSKPAIPEKEWFSLPGLLEEIQQLLRQSGSLKENCHLSVAIPAALDCWADRRQMQRVLVNLLHNSCNALEETGGEIKIAASVTENNGQERFTIMVSDTGPGIPEHLHEKIFEPFFTTRENGTGLGLAIVRQIIESHDGEIKVAESTPSGSSFAISLPLP
jgi:two-component system, NtrC family, sensor histidine kinase PilS